MGITIRIVAIIIGFVFAIIGFFFEFSEKKKNLTILKSQKPTKKLSADILNLEGSIKTGKKRLIVITSICILGIILGSYITYDDYSNSQILKIQHITDSSNQSQTEQDLSGLKTDYKDFKAHTKTNDSALSVALAKAHFRIDTAKNGKFYLVGMIKNQSFKIDVAGTNNTVSGNKITIK